MKKSELKRLVAEYIEVKTKIKKSQNQRDRRKMEEIRHRYFHETGRALEEDFSDI